MQPGLKNRVMRHSWYRSRHHPSLLLLKGALLVCGLLQELPPALPDLLIRD
jgi:hypothetical protein